MTSSRLSPTNESNGLLHRIAQWVSKKQFGTVLSPIRTLYARKPGLLVAARVVTLTAERGLSLDDALRDLLQVHVARLNGCPFCQDLVLAQAARDNLGPERFEALADYRSSSVFTSRERAALAFAEEVLRDRRVHPETYATAQTYFSETKLVELAWVVASETYFNLQTAAFDLASDGLSGIDVGDASTGS